MRRILAILSVGALCTLLMSCGDDKKPVPDKKVVTPDAAIVDDMPQYPDMPPSIDKPIWPDRPKVDLPKPQEAYVSTPFGCQVDSDCFGQKCCATPWGVKLCAPSCEIK